MKKTVILLVAVMVLSLMTSFVAAEEIVYGQGLFNYSFDDDVKPNFTRRNSPFTASAASAAVITTTVGYNGGDGKVLAFNYVPNTAEDAVANQQVIWDFNPAAATTPTVYDPQKQYKFSFWMKLSHEIAGNADVKLKFGNNQSGAYNNVYYNNANGTPNPYRFTQTEWTPVQIIFDGSSPIKTRFLMEVHMLTIPAASYPTGLTLYIDDLKVEEFDGGLGVGSKEIIPDGGFERTPMINGQILREPGYNGAYWNCSAGDDTTAYYSKTKKNSGEYSLYCATTGSSKVLTTTKKDYPLDYNKIYRVSFWIATDKAQNLRFVDSSNKEYGDTLSIPAAANGAYYSFLYMSKEKFIDVFGGEYIEANWGAYFNNNNNNGGFGLRTYNNANNTTGGFGIRFNLTAGSYMYLDDFSMHEVSSVYDIPMVYGLDSFDGQNLSIKMSSRQPLKKAFNEIMPRAYQNFFAVYNKEGVLVDAYVPAATNLTSYNAETWGTHPMVEFSLSKPVYDGVIDNGYYLKIFTFDTKDSLKPFKSVQSISLNKIIN